MSSINALMNPDGKLPTEDKETYTQIVCALIKQWDIKKPAEIMLVNRMVATWMKLLRVEKMLGKYDLFFEKFDKDGNMIGVNVNQLAQYLRLLEDDFRSYYKVLQPKPTAVGTDEIKDFHDFLNSTKVKNVKTRSKKDKA